MENHKRNDWLSNFVIFVLRLLALVVLVGGVAAGFMAAGAAYGGGALIFVGFIAGSVLSAVVLFWFSEVLQKLIEIRTVLQEKNSSPN